MRPLGSQPVTLTRYPVPIGSGYDSTGKWAPGSPTTSTIYCTVEPAPSRLVEKLPEHERSKDVRQFIAETGVSFIVSEPGAKTQSDRLTVGGRTYEVRFIEPGWVIIAHETAIAVEVDEAD